MIKEISTPEEMIELWKELAQKGHTHILLNGELWAGKTHFAKGFAEWLSLDPTVVTSPTYTYTQSYGLEDLLHCDFYRLEDKHELWAKWILDSIEDHAAAIIEWPKRESEYSDEDWLCVTITKTSPTTRSVEIIPY